MAPASRRRNRELRGARIRFSAGQIEKWTRVPRYVRQSASESQGETLLRVLADDLCAFSNSVVNADTFARDWLLERLRTSHVVLIFDSVDELLANHPQLQLSHLRRLQEYLASLPDASRVLSLVFGGRSSQRGLNALASSPSAVFEIGPLSAGEASEYGLRPEHLQALPPALRTSFLTPLYCRHLATWLAGHGNRPPRPHTDIQMILVNVLLEESKLLQVAGGDGLRVDLEQWLDAIMLISWIWYRDFRGSGGLAEEELFIRVPALREEWAGLPATTADESATAQRICRAFELLSSERHKTLLINRTVFVQVGAHGGRSLRFGHRELLELLVGRYLCTCLSAGNVRQLGATVFTSKMSRTAAEFFENFTLEGHLVRKILATYKELKGAQEDSKANFVIGNFLALFGNLRSRMTGDTIELLLGLLPRLEPPAAHVLLDSLGHRALRQPDDDPAAEVIRFNLIPILVEYSNGGVANANVVTRSSAWCYLRAYEQRGLRGVMRGAGSWIGLRSTEADVRAGLQLAWKDLGDGGVRFLTPSSLV